MLGTLLAQEVRGLLAGFLKLISGASLLVLLSGCAGLHEPIHTERVTVTGKSIEQVRNASVAYLVGDGWTLKASDPLLLRFEKESGMGEQLMYNQAGFPPARDRFTLTLLPAGASVDMMGHLVIVHHHDQENSTDRANSRGRFVFSCVRAAVLGEPSPQPPKAEPRAPAKTGKGAN